MQIRTIHTQFDYHRISFSVSLAARLSLTPSHSHALQQLIRFINSYHCLSSESIMSAYREVSRLSWLPPFFSSSAILHIRLLVQKLRQIFPFTLFSLFFLFYNSLVLSLPLLLLGDHNATHESVLVDETIHHNVVSHARFFF